MVSERGEQYVVLPYAADMLHAGQMAQATVVVDHNGALGAEARAAGHLLQQPEQTGAAVFVHDERPAVRGHR